MTIKIENFVGEDVIGKRDRNNLFQSAQQNLAKNWKNEKIQRDRLSVKTRDLKRKINRIIIKLEILCTKL